MKTIDHTENGFLESAPWKLVAILLTFVVALFMLGGPFGLLMFFLFPAGLVVPLQGWLLSPDCPLSTFNDTYSSCADMWHKLEGIGWLVYGAVGIPIALLRQRWLVIGLFVVFFALIVVNFQGCQAIQHAVPMDCTAGC